ncbi:MAG: calcium-binding protein [Methylococcales bacterium]|nr:calcium-binding protein [Methylococcales bacterium]
MTAKEYIDKLYNKGYGTISPNGYDAMIELLDSTVGLNTINALIAAKKFNLTIEDTSDYSSSSYDDQLVYLSGEDKFGFVIGQNKYGFSTIATMLIHELGHILNKNYSEQEVIENYENPYRAAKGYDIRTGYRANNEWMPYTIQKNASEPLQWNYYNGGTANGGSYTYTAHKNTESFDVTVVGNDDSNTFEMGIGNDTLIGNGGNDTLIGGAGNDYFEGGAGNDVLHGGVDEDILWGGADNDRLYGDGEHDILYGDTGSDALIGGTGSDELYGGEGNDVLIGNDGYGSADTESDVLDGGEGYDTYIAGNGDTIYDSDGSGIIVFEGKVLHGVDVTMDSTIYPSGEDHTVYYSKVDHGTYYRNGNSGFSFVADNGHWLNVFTPLDYTEKVIPKPGGGTMKDKTYRGVGVILENFSSPLVLDLNHDGVTSLDLYATPAYFDMEKDGIREKTGWIQSTDALLAFDKNQDGIINDGSELFGNNTTLANGTKADNGFTALAQYDNNQDGVIDKNDAVYDSLSAWVDTNQDGVTDTGELHTLSELGVTSINLNATTTTNNPIQRKAA